MANNTTELVFIIDKSGSMAGLKQDTIGGFNSMIEKQKKLDGEVYVSTVLFNHKSFVIHDRIPIKDVQPMTEMEYCACGSTALLDAIGGAIHHIFNIHKYARKEDIPDKTLFIITTDGMENASRMYGSEEVRNMITQMEEKHGWEFLFVAANIDAVQTAESIGIRRERAANYTHTKQGTKEMYCVVEQAVRHMRTSSKIDDNWAKDLNDKE